MLARVKQEIGLFLSDSVQVDQKWLALLGDLKMPPPVCGTGHIAFNITNVKMEFSAVSDVKGGANAGFKIPVLPTPAAANISPSVTATSENTSTENISYLYYPPTPSEYAATEAALAKKGVTIDQFDNIRQTAVIAPALDAMRDGLVRNTANYPCFLNADPKSPDNSLVFTVALVKDTSTSFGFNFYIVSLGASAENKTTGTNTIAVSFHPDNTPVKPVPKPKA